MAKILISGGSGFIGSHLTSKLRKLKHQVYILDSNIFYLGKKSDFQKKILQYKKKNLIGNTKVFKGTSINKKTLEKILNKIKPDYVINLGALPLAKNAISNPEDAFNSIVLGAKNFAHCLKGKKYLKKFIHISSSMVYGNFKHNFIEENHEKNPIEIYGSMKFASEILVKGYARIFNINSIILRPSAVYGPCDMNYRIVQKILDNCIKGKPTTLNNAKKNLLDFTFVEDVAEAIKCATFAKTKNLEVFNITYGKGRSLYELSKIIKKYFPNSKFIYSNKNNFYPKRGSLNISKIKKIAGYKPRFYLEKGIDHYINFYKEHIL